MSTSVPPIPQQAAPEGLSEPQRIINTFTAPSKTFTDLRRNASWWVPWLIGAIFGGVVLGLFYKKVDLDQFVHDQITNSRFQAQAFENLSKEQQDQRVALSVKITRYTPYAVPVFFLVIALIVAAILMAVFNFVHEASVSYSRSLAIFFYGGLPGLITAILGIITLMTTSDMEGRNPQNLVATNPAYFMDYHNTSKFLYGMAQSLDLITIWVIVLLGIGFKINSAKPKLSTGTAIATVFTVYLVYRLVVSSLGWV